MCLTTPSTCSWLDHPVSGLLNTTYRSFKTRFRFAYTLWLKLAALSNSLTHYTKGTPSHQNGAPTVCRHSVSGLFHSPLGVLFTFPSRYLYTIGHWVVLRLGEWSPHVQTELHVFRPTRIHFIICYVYGTITLFCWFFHIIPLKLQMTLAWSDFARHYFRSLFWFPFLQVLRCFSSLRSLQNDYEFIVWYH